MRLETTLVEIAIFVGILAKDLDAAVMLLIILEYQLVFQQLN